MARVKNIQRETKRILNFAICSWHRIFGIFYIHFFFSCLHSSAMVNGDDGDDDVGCRASVQCKMGESIAGRYVRMDNEIGT